MQLPWSEKTFQNLKPWLFEGDYESYSIPDYLSTLVKWIIVGPKNKIDESPKKQDTIDISVRNTSEIIIKSFKTKRQVNYVTDNTFRTSQLSLETLFSVGLGLYLHQRL